MSTSSSKSRNTIAEGLEEMLALLEHLTVEAYRTEENCAGILETTTALLRATLKTDQRRE
ncbi:hypothetical protein [Teichococcus vastitatis]|jgi:hypothetical protein|uniref:hypothetical protein n=1 Tax=Teichococcus vastitatis TaxID=2307076 RepID=UPI000E76752A|nr:hypothetical protein [Pseudoroseomonas vastitatis]